MQYNDIFEQARPLSGDARTEFLQDKAADLGIDADDFVSEFAAWQVLGAKPNARDKSDPNETNEGEEASATSFTALASHDELEEEILKWRDEYFDEPMSNRKKETAWNHMLNEWSKLPPDTRRDYSVLELLVDAAGKRVNKKDFREVCKKHLADCRQLNSTSGEAESSQAPSSAPDLDTVIVDNMITEAIVYARTCGHEYNEDAVNAACGGNLHADHQHRASLIVRQMQWAERSDSHLGGTRYEFEYDGTIFQIVEKGRGRNAYEARSLVSKSVVLAGKARNFEGNGWSYVFEFKDDSGTWKRALVPCADVNPRDHKWAQSLRDAGAVIQDTSELAKLITCAPGVEVVNLAVRSGWQDESYTIYALPNGGIIGSDKTIARFKKRQGYSKRGTLEAANREIFEKCVGNSRLVLGVCTGLSALFLRPMNVSPGIIHVFGESGTGKTTCQRVALATEASGHSILAWRATDNGLETLAASSNDGTIVFEDGKQTDGEVLFKAIMMLGNGTGKVRASRNAEARDVEHFTTIMNSSGEASVRSMISSSKASYDGGVASRCADIPVDAGCNMGAFENLHGAKSPSDFSKSLEAAAKENYGHHVPALLEAYLADPVAAIKELRTYMDDFLAGIALSSEENVTRPAERFALMAAVGEFASKRGILPWPSGEATRGILKAVQAWRGYRYGPEDLVGNTEVTEAVRRFRNKLSTDGESFEWLPGKEPSEPRRIITRDRLGFRGKVDVGEAFYMNRETLERIVGAERIESFLKALKSNRIPRLFLKTDKGRNQLTTPADARVELGDRCYCIVVSTSEEHASKSATEGVPHTGLTRLRRWPGRKVRIPNSRKPNGQPEHGGHSTTMH